jgi:hypothetical protein
MSESTCRVTICDEHSFIGHLIECAYCQSRKRSSIHHDDIMLHLEHFKHPYQGPGCPRRAEDRFILTRCRWDAHDIRFITPHRLTTLSDGLARNHSLLINQQPKRLTDMWAYLQKSGEILRDNIAINYAHLFGL